MILFLTECIRIINRSKTYLKKRYYAEKFHHLKNNIKLTWRLINEILGNNPNKSISTKFNINDKCITDQQEIANHFNSFFASIGTKISQQIKIMIKLITDGISLIDQ